MSAPHSGVVAATAAQLDRRRAALRAGAGRVGWKLALDIPEIEAVIGDAPALGHLTTATLLEDGASFDASAVGSPRAETELALIVGPGGSVAGYAVALELVDVARPPDDLEGIVEANVFHRAVAFGPVRTAPPEPDAHGRAIVDGRVRAQASLRADPTAVVDALAALLAAHGERLEPGDRLLTGAVTHVPVAPGEAVIAEIDGLGCVAAKMRASPPD